MHVQNYYHVKLNNAQNRNSNINIKFSFLDLVAFYDFYVPEGERHDSALKRNRDNLVTELKLWESYLENVCLTTAHNKDM